VWLARRGRWCSKMKNSTSQAYAHSWKPSFAARLDLTLSEWWRGHPLERPGRQDNRLSQIKSRRTAPSALAVPRPRRCRCPRGRTRNVARSGTEQCIRLPPRGRTPSSAEAVERHLAGQGPARNCEDGTSTALLTPNKSVN